jgi:hypothetical protein
MRIANKSLSICSQQQAVRLWESFQAAADIV